MTTEKDQSRFTAAYGAIFYAASLAEAMCDEKGKLKPTPRAKVEELKRACREANCAAGALQSLHDGQPSKI